MPSFILTAIDDDGTNTTKEFTSEGLKEVVEKTSDFLKGVGYVYDDLTSVSYTHLTLPTICSV